MDVCVHLDWEGEDGKMGVTCRGSFECQKLEKPHLGKAPVQQEASGSKGEMRAVVSMERAPGRASGCKLGELARHVCSHGETEGRQECVTTEITGFRAHFGRGQAK